MQKTTTTKAAKPGFDPRPPARRGRKFIEFFVVLAVFLGFLFWAGGAYPNRDALWFNRTFDAQPSVVRIYRYGDVRELLPSDPEYPGLVAAINHAIEAHS